MPRNPTRKMTPGRERALRLVYGAGGMVPFNRLHEHTAEDCRALGWLAAETVDGVRGIQWRITEAGVRVVFPAGEAGTNPVRPLSAPTPLPQSGVAGA